MRRRWTMQAPADAGEAIIEGTAYDPADDPTGRGRVEVVNEGHVKVLKRHGYVEVADDPSPKPAPIGFLDPDELGMSDLRAALAVRGVEGAEGMDREAATTAAAEWNKAFRRRHQRTEALDHDGDGRPGGSRPTHPAPVAEGGVDVAGMSADEAKAWLTEKGVAFNPKTPVATLRRMVAAEAAKG